MSRNGRFASLPGLMSLPVEILQSICSLLCPHCNYSHVVDLSHDLVDDLVQSQCALASLSRSSRLLQSIAQPLLFHFYMTEYPGRVNNTPTFMPTRFGESIPDGIYQFETSRFARHLREKHRLSLFIRTILARRDLLGQIRALSFYGVPWDNIIKDEPQRMTEHLELEQRQNKITTRTALQARSVLLEMPSQVAALGSVDGGGYLAAGVLKQVESRESVNLEQLQELIMALSSPYLEQLCLERSSHSLFIEGASHDWREWTYPLPRLWYLAFSGLRNPGDGTYYYKETHHLVKSAPGLRVLVAPDCNFDIGQGGFNGHTYGNWDATLPVLTKLSIDGISRADLRLILEGCPMLEDLEYYREFNGFEHSILSPEKDLARVKGTLKRLCYSVLRDRKHDPSYDPEFYVMGGEAYPSWADMPNLACLEIERMLLYGPLNQEQANHDSQDAVDVGIITDGSGTDDEDDIADEYDSNDDMTRSVQVDQESQDLQPKLSKMEVVSAEDLLGRLPPSLEKLHIGHIRYWPAMYRDVVALAECAPARFSLLRQVQLDVLDTMPEEHDVSAVKNMLLRVGVICEIETVEPKTASWDRGLLPFRPGQATQFKDLEDD